MKTGLVKFDAAIHAIEIASSIDEVKEIRNKAEACRKYAQQAGESLKGQNMLANIKITAERKAGRMLKEMAKHKGGRPLKTHDIVSSVSTLDEMGISCKQSERYNDYCLICGTIHNIEIHHEDGNEWVLCHNHHLLITTGRATIKGLLEQKQRAIKFLEKCVQPVSNSAKPNNNIQDILDEL